MGGHSVARRHGQGLVVPNMKFFKNGEEIQKAIANRVEILNSEIKTSKTLIEDICKRREIDSKEVLEAGDDEVKTAAYSEKAFSKGPKANSAIRELEAEIMLLKSHGYEIVRTGVLINELDRVRKNIQIDTVFSLSFDEICDLGF